MLITGTFFTLFKFERPENFKPLQWRPKSNLSQQGQTPMDKGSKPPGKPNSPLLQEITNRHLINLIPRNCIEVVYFKAPVFRDLDAQQPELSNVMIFTVFPLFLL